MLARKIAIGSGLIATLVAVIALTGGLTRLRGQDAATAALLFLQQDKVIEFNNITGEGVQIGSATGQINGVSIVNFKLSVADSGLPNIILDNRVGITDLDGDQIVFHNTGTGHYITNPLTDPSGTEAVNQPFGTSPIPCPGFGGDCAGVGGPLSGTYTVVATSGKYINLFPIGKSYPYRGVIYNPSSPPATPTDTGAVYIEVQGTSVN